MTTSASSSAAIVLMPTTPHLVWSATTASRRAERTSARLVSASSRLGLVNPVRWSMPCTPRKSRSRLQRPQRRHGDRADQGVGRRADAAGEHDGLVGSRRLVEDVGDLDRVGDDGDAGDVEQPVREGPGGGAGREPDRDAGLAPGSAATPAMASFSSRSRADLASKPGSSVLRARRRRWRRRAPCRAGPRRRAGRGRGGPSCPRRRGARGQVADAHARRARRSSLEDGACRCCASTSAPPSSRTTATPPAAHLDRARRTVVAGEQVGAGARRPSPAGRCG